MHLVDAYLDACVVDIGRAVDAGLPEATSVFFGGGTPSLVPAEALMRVLDHIPLARGAEVTVECNPDTVDAGAAARVSPRRREPPELRCAVDGAARARFARAHPRSRERDVVGRGGTRGRVRLVQPRPHLRRSGRVAERLDLDARARARARPAARRARTASRSSRALRWPTSPNVIPTTTIKPTSTSSPTACSPTQGWRATRSRTGRSLASSAGTTSSTGRRGSTSASGARHTRIATGVRWWNVRTPERYVEAITAGQLTDRCVRASRRRRTSHRGAAARSAHARGRADGRAAGGARGPRGTQRRSRRADRARSTARERGRVAAQLRGGSSKT